MKHQVNSPHSSALVDYSGLAKTVGDLIRAENLRPLELIDFFALTEALILNDRLVVIGGKWPENHPTSDLLNRLDAAGIFDYASTSPISLPGGPPREGERRTERYGGWTPEDGWYEAGRVLGAERELKVPPVDFLRHRREYRRYGLVLEQHAVCDLMGRYRDLSLALQEVRNASRLDPIPLFQLPTPPLPVLLLERCRRRDDLLSTALELRDEFTSLRKSLADLRAMLADASVSPRKKLTEIEKWQRSWATLNRWSDKGGSLAANVDLGSIDVDVKLGDLPIPSLKLIEIIQWLIKESIHQRNQWRIRPLHRIANRYLNIPDSRIVESMQRLFGDDAVVQLADLRRWVMQHLGQEDYD